MVGAMGAWRGGCPGIWESQGLGAATNSLAGPRRLHPRRQAGMAMGLLSDQELEGKATWSNHRTYPNPTSCKRKPGPGLHRGTEQRRQPRLGSWSGEAEGSRRGRPGPRGSQPEHSGGHPDLGLQRSVRKISQ